MSGLASLTIGFHLVQGSGGPQNWSEHGSEEKILPPPGTEP